MENTDWTCSFLPKARDFDPILTQWRAQMGVSTRGAAISYGKSPCFMRNHRKNGPLSNCPCHFHPFSTAMLNYWRVLWRCSRTTMWCVLMNICAGVSTLFFHAEPHKGRAAQWSRHVATLTHRLTNTLISATGPAEPSILFGPKIDQTDSPHWFSTGGAVKMRIEIESACHPTWWAWEFESRDFLRTVNIYTHPDFWSEIDVNFIRFLPSSCHWPFYHLKTGGQKGYPWESGSCGNPVYVIHSNIGTGGFNEACLKYLGAMWLQMDNTSCSPGLWSHAHCSCKHTTYVSMASMAIDQNWNLLLGLGFGVAQANADVAQANADGQHASQSI